MPMQNFFSASAVDATSAAKNRRGNIWNYQATIDGTGAVSATVTIQGSNDGTNWHTIGTAISLTATTTDSDTTSSIIPWALHRAVIASISGTGAVVSVNGFGV